MKNLSYILLILCYTSCTAPVHKLDVLNTDHILNEERHDHKLVIYQTLVRHFGNTHTVNKKFGSIEENGSGKFNDFSEKALDELKNMGITHIWYTGVIEQATMTDYSSFGIAQDDPDIVKGRAGSPYAIKDYYDVSPDLAVDVPSRMKEFEALVARTHQQKLKVIIDFIPNHVARTYRSDAKPEGVLDFGEEDDTSVAFSPSNDFYYTPHTRLVIPAGYDAGGPDFKNPAKDGKFDENPAKATGNNVFSATPSINDWSETIKLNYGLHVQHDNTPYFDPMPSVWGKMKDILLFWADKGVDGFRCDVAEMVPVEFWSWVITEVKKEYPDMLFIAEAYNPKEYRNFLEKGKFDYLYDKVGLYDGLKKLIRHEQDSDVSLITKVWSEESRGFSVRMLRFLENHDEHRVASKDFAGDPWLAVPAMVVSATLASGPVMIYSGQEVGEPGTGDEGHGTEDGRTSIFDYWGVPQHQKWVNNGKFDGGQLSPDETKLREFYKTLLSLVRTEQAIRQGGFYDLILAQPRGSSLSNRIYTYIRYTETEKILVVANFECSEQEVVLAFPSDVVEAFGLDNSRFEAQELLSGEKRILDFSEKKLTVELPAHGAYMLKF